jgi:hypothetical protein
MRLSYGLALSVLMVGASVANAAETATGQVAVQSVSGPTTTFTITLNDTGTTNIGTFWYGWIPGNDFLASLPTVTASPTGWGSSITGSGNSSDGYAIEWTNQSGAALTPGGHFTFSFSSADSLAHPSTLVGTSFIYSGGAFSDSGYQFVVTTVPEPGALAILALGATALMARRRGWRRS